MKYHGKIIKVIKPSLYDDLDGKIYEIYDLNGKLLHVEPYLDDAKFYIDNGYSIN